MGYKRLQLKLPTSYNDQDLKAIIEQQTNLSGFDFKIEKKSLDARKKEHIHWLVNVLVKSDSLSGKREAPTEEIQIPHKKRNQKILVVGSGPAGFFAAHTLQKAGYSVILMERGSEVDTRTEAIQTLENKGKFNSSNNYAFGEGGAGTFSDGKLTSRSKHISAEREYILNAYVRAGAPEEILYLSHPHLGTDNLKIIVRNLRQEFIQLGGTILFETQLENLIIAQNKVTKIISNKGEHEADYLFLATGHSAYDTYRMLIERGVGFRTKNFAIGHRIEHAKKLINRGQWGKENLPGVKAAEYRLTTKTSKGIPVYTFCMCPGGMVVPAAAYDTKSVVNGMSYYQRDGSFSNAGCVAGVHPDALIGRSCSPAEILDWMDRLEEQFYEFSGNYCIPGNRAQDYMSRLESNDLPHSSYPLGVKPARLFKMVPDFVSSAIAEGLVDFGRKLKGFDSGLLMGLESKTSSPIQVIRERDGRCTDFDNLYFIGEGSGYAGGIISSAADGVRCAMGLIQGD